MKYFMRFEMQELAHRRTLSDEVQSIQVARKNRVKILMR